MPVEYVYPGTTMIVVLTTLPIDNHRKKYIYQEPPLATQQNLKPEDACCLSKYK